MGENATSSFEGCTFTRNTAVSVNIGVAKFHSLSVSETHGVRLCDTQAAWSWGGCTICISHNQTQCCRHTAKSSHAVDPMACVQADALLRVCVCVDGGCVDVLTAVGGGLCGTWRMVAGRK